MIGDLINLALFALVFAVAEAILIFGAFPAIWRRIRRWWRQPSAFAPSLPKNVRAGCGHLTASWNGEVPLFCNMCRRKVG